MPGDDHYAFFAEAAGEQDGWTSVEHRGFWESHVSVSLWPRPVGRPPTTQTIGWWSLTLRQHGFSDDEIADLLYPRANDSYRRRRIPGVIEMLQDEEIDGVVGLQPPYRLPRIFVGDRPDPVDVARAEVSLSPTAIAGLRPPAALKVELLGYRALHGRQEQQSPRP